jgi:hypothetical protein
MSKARLLCLFCLFLLPCFAYAELPPLSDEDRKFNAVPGQPGAPAAVLFHEEIYDDMRHAHDVRERVKILTEEGRKYADVTIPYNRRMQLVNVSGRTIHADGKVVQFQGKPYEKTLYKGLGRKYAVKAFSLPDVQVGSIIEYEFVYLYQDGVVYAPEWIVQKDLWQKRIHYKFIPFTSMSRFVVIDHDQSSRGVAWTTYLPKEWDVKNVRMPNNQDYVELDVSSVPAFIEEPYMPDSDQFKYHVRFYYAVARNENDYWKSEGKYWNKDVEHFLDKHSAVQEAVAKVVSPSDTPEQKARKIYAFVIGLDNDDFLPPRSEQEIRALGFKGVNGADDVLLQKRGDSIDLTRLFIALARAAGLNAYAMRITSRENNYFETAYMDASQLNAEIAVLQIDGKDVFLDPGAKFCRYGLLDWRHTATKGLRQTPNGTVIAETPDPIYKDAMTQRIGHLMIKEDGSLAGPIRVIYVGQDAATHRQNAAKTDEEGRKKDLEDEVRAWFPADTEVKLAKQPNWDEVEAPLAADFQVSARLLVNAGKRLLLPSQVFRSQERPKFPHAERVNGIYIYYPSREVDQITIALPPGIAIENLPEKQKVQLDYAIYSNAATNVGSDAIRVDRDIAMAAYVFPKEKYPEIKSFYDKVRNLDEQQLILRSAANATAGN